MARGLLLIVVSLSVLSIALKHVWQAQRYLQASTGQRAHTVGRGRFIIWAWIAALLVGGVLVAMFYR